MLKVFWRLTRGYRLRPWRSPYLRWRIETYQGWHAEEIGFARFWGFAWRERRNLMRYVRWAAENGKSSVKTPSSAGAAGTEN
jgi:hypothetical protein